MSSGVVHQRSSVILAGGFLIGGFLTGDPSAYAYAAGALTGVLLSPDLDVDKAFIGDKIILKRLGGFSHRVWRNCWHFYRKSIKHGSELSHFPVVSTLGRIFYLFLFCVIVPNIILSFFGWDFASETAWWFGKLCQSWRVVLGLMGSDFIHWVMDIATRNDSFDLGSLLSGRTQGKRRKTWAS